MVSQQPSSNGNGHAAPPIAQTFGATALSDPRDVALPKDPVLRFTPEVWAKMLYMRDKGDTEVGGMGITDPNDPLLVVDFVTLKQECTSASVEIDDDALAGFMEDQVLAGRKPADFMRVWIHFHPGNSAQPSSMTSSSDEQVFARFFKDSDYAVMFILAKGGDTYCRLRFNVGPGGSMEIPSKVVFTHEFKGTDRAAWDKEYAANVHRKVFTALSGFRKTSTTDDWDFMDWASWYGPHAGVDRDWGDVVDEMEKEARDKAGKAASSVQAAEAQKHQAEFNFLVRSYDQLLDHCGFKYRSSFVDYLLHAFGIPIEEGERPDSDEMFMAIMDMIRRGVKAKDHHDLLIYIADDMGLTQDVAFADDNELADQSQVGFLSELDAEPVNEIQLGESDSPFEDIR